MMGCIPNDPSIEALFPRNAFPRIIPSAKQELPGSGERIGHMQPRLQACILILPGYV